VLEQIGVKLLTAYRLYWSLFQIAGTLHSHLNEQTTGLFVELIKFASGEFGDTLINDAYKPAQRCS